ncbi:MAG: CBS domain-containing protein [Asgard group archaeon]
MIWGDFSNLNRFIVSEENQLSDVVGKFSSLEVEQLFVVDDKGKLLGLISPHDLFDKPMNSKVSSLM